MVSAKYCPDPYDVTQEGNGVDIVVRVVSEDGAAFETSSVTSTLTSKAVSFTYKDETLVEGSPWAAIDEDDSIWTVETKQAKSGKGCVHIVTVHLEKKDPRPWPLAIKGPIGGTAQPAEGSALDASAEEADAADTTADRTVDVVGDTAADASAEAVAETGDGDDTKDAGDSDDTKDAGEGDDTKDAGEGDDTPKDAGEGDVTPKDAGDGDVTPKDAGDGDVTPKDAGDGDASNTDAGAKEDARGAIPYAAGARLDTHSLYLLANAADTGGLPLFTRKQQLAMYLTASDRGSPVARYRLWQIMGRGEEESGFAGVERDNAAAMGYLVQSAEAGYVPAIVHAGMAYATGDGCDKDLARGVAFLERAGRLGYTSALTMAAQIHQNGGEGLPVSGPKAVELYTEAAVRGDARAAFNLGVLNANGCGSVGQDIDRAVAWWHKAHTMDPSLPKPQDILRSLGVQAGLSGSSSGEAPEGAAGGSAAERAQAQARAQARAALQARAAAAQAAAAGAGGAGGPRGAAPGTAGQGGSSPFPVGAVLPLAVATVAWGLMAWHRWTK